VGVIAVDGGNSKTDVLAVDGNGSPLAWVRGPGSNAQGAGGAAGCVAVIERTLHACNLALPFEAAALFLCGADSSRDIAELTALVEPRGWARSVSVENDTFAVLYAGADTADAVAVVCGAGINCVAQAAGARRSQHPALGWPTGDWGGAESLGRRALFHAVRGEDGRGPATELTELVRVRFGSESAVAVGWAIHRGERSEPELGTLAEGVLELAAQGDAIAAGLVDVLADEIVALARRGLRDVGLERAPLVLAGGMLAPAGALYERVIRRLPAELTAVTPAVAPVVGGALAGLRATGASDASLATLETAWARGLSPAAAP
jgi:N-acetylglucosamine kinase-like BadF-type ATPase